MAPQIAPSDLFPAVLRFLTESGLTKSAAKFQKETGVDTDAAASLPKLEQVYSSWMATNGTNGKATNEISVESEVLSKKEKKKRKASEAAAAEEAAAALAAAAAAAAAEVPKKRKRTKSTEVAEEVPAEAEAAPEKKKKKEEKPEKVKGQAFQRIDDDQWRAKIKDPRLLDNTHKAKVKFGMEVDTGDSWADKASEDLLKVKGKDFRKEMMKKKKASWKGGGALDQGVNSIPFSDSE